MKVTNILKDGTVVEDISTVVIPREIQENIISVIRRGKKDGKAKKDTTCN